MVTTKTNSMMAYTSVEDLTGTMAVSYTHLDVYKRQGLFLAGYYDYFDKLRLQILGLAEMNFLSGLSAEKRYERCLLYTSRCV